MNLICIESLYCVSFISSLRVLYTTVNKFISCAYKQNKSFVKHVKLTVFPHSLYFSISYIKREKKHVLIAFKISVKTWNYKEE